MENIENNMMKIEKIHFYYREGLIPGPTETEYEFIRRAEFCLSLHSEWGKINDHSLPFDEENAASKEILKESHALTRKLFGITPNWVPLFFSNYKLPPWHGGCAWIFQLNDTTPFTAFLQLRAAFSTRKLYLGLYERNELIAHEMAHIGRMMFEEPKFEEILAFQSSPSAFRRYLGPIVQSSRESFIFLLVLGLVLMVNLALPSAFAINFIPIAFFLYGLGRLYYRQKKLADCLKNLGSLFEHPVKAHHLAYCLTDREIMNFAVWSPVQIKDYIEEKSLKENRWKFIKIALSESLWRDA